MQKSQKSKLRYAIFCFLVMTYVLLMICTSMESKYLESNKKVVITAQAGSGIVTFRGAQVDETWYNPQDLIVSADGWDFQEEENVLTDTAGNPVILNLPIGVERILVFNVGPEEGVVNISVNRNALEWNLYRAEQAEFGERFQLPYVRFSNKIKLSILSVCMIILLAGIMEMFNLYFRKTYPREGKLKSGKNSSVEFLRFFIIMCVVVHHYCGWVPGGYLGVDFFFVLSGFFLMRHFMCSDASSKEDPAILALKYTQKRYLRILPDYLLAFFLSFGLSVCLWDGNAPIRMLENNFWELSMLEAFGFTESLMVGPGWFCSALLIAGFCVYYLLARNQKLYTCVIAPISMFVILAWMSHSFGNLNRWLQFDTFISTGTLRGFAEMGLGCISYQLYILLKEKNIGSKTGSTIFEFFCMCYIVYIMFKIGPSQNDFVCIFVMAALISSLFLGKSLWSKILNIPLSQFLGTISIGIYLNHVILAKVNWYGLCARLGFSWYTTLIIYLLVVVLFSAISTHFIKVFIQVSRNINYRL